MINTERDFHMVGGEGEISYARNSRVQNKAMMETKSILDKVTQEVYTGLLPRNMVIADLGCSSGPNTLRFVSEVINIITKCQNKLGQIDLMDLQFFLNDLPGNDFNHLFRTLETFKKANETNHEGEIVPAYYICGVPGSYYTRFFPQQTIHLFHSSISLHWLSQVPEELNGRKKVYLNEENIYITKTTPQSVVKLFQEQFYKDFSLFLTLRHEELVLGGQMVLTFCGRKDEDACSGSELNNLFGLLALSLQSLVAEGLVEKENLESFNLPLYGPSVGEVDEIVKNVNLFEMDHIDLFECNWDPYDDSQGDIVHDSALSGMNVAKCIRAALQPLIASYFGEDILNALFEEYAHRVAKHLEKDKGKFAFIVVSLKKRCYIKIGS
uniref:Uncharacterized protein n=1 Tax=Oryza glumipatula TaxID=40148 RepID=A0A0E0A7E7_9ORYZ